MHVKKSVFHLSVYLEAVMSVDEKYGADGLDLCMTLMTLNGLERGLLHGGWYLRCWEGNKSRIFALPSPLSCSVMNKICLNQE